jgi:2-polyprenyl-3-methyl-5-hydroxy-6-metoxy-1,4-benzoquinol methylase
MKRVCCVCGQDNYTPLYKPAKSPGPVVRCNACGFVYVTPIEQDKALIQKGPVLDGRPEYLLESADVSQIEGSWEQPIIESYMREANARKENSREALTHIQALNPNRGKILDYGCFAGLFLSVAKEQGWDCYGLEPLVMPSIYARGNFGVNVVNNTLEGDTFPADMFDVITAFQVFEHIIDPVGELSKLKGFLKSGGLMMIEVPNIDTLGVRLLQSNHRHFVEDHVSFFSGKTLSQLLEDQGFEVCEVYYPVRVLSVSHLAWWMGKLTTQSVGDYVKRVTDRLNLTDKTLKVGIGDIVSVIARKK